MGTTTFLVRTSIGSTSTPDVPMHIVDEIRGEDIMSTRPWDGDCPPRSIYADSVFVRRDDGIWCKKDTAGRLYPVNINGERCARPRKPGVGIDPVEGQRRPSSISSHVWWKMMTKAERAQWWHDHPDAASATKSLPSVDCSPLGISSLIDVTSKSAISIWSLPTIDSYASNDDASSSDEDDDSSLDRESYPWDDWDALVQELDTSNDACVAGSSAAPAIPRMPHQWQSLIVAQRKDWFFSMS